MQAGGQCQFTAINCAIYEYPVGLVLLSLRVLIADNILIGFRNRKSFNLTPHLRQGARTKALHWRGYKI